MNKWQLENKLTAQNLKFKDIIGILLQERGIRTKKEIDEFLNPNLSDISADKVGIDKNNLQKALKRINIAIKTQEKIIIYGDYDVDGICASAILWETLNSLGADVMPFIPSRFDEGYGLSKEGIDSLLSKQKADLIITVDNGIVAEEGVSYANKKGVDVIITDHHSLSKRVPDAFAIVHTTKLCGAGVAYILSQEIRNQESGIRNPQADHLSLVALATVADLVPLTGANRTLLYFGLKDLKKTQRPGLLALINKAGIRKEDLGVYEIGYIIAPRLNAMGRLESAMDSLRLICTSNKKRAESLAGTLSDTNLQRQQITIKTLEHAKGEVNKKPLKKLIFIASESYQQGIVGLVAGRLVEEYYLPSIVVSKGPKLSKASARSVKGFNITEFLRTASDLLVDVGGHPMAAGFTVETKKLKLLEDKLYKTVEELLNVKHLERVLRIDMELPEGFISQSLYSEIQQLDPFGMGNPEPTFLTRNLTVENLRIVGNDGKHLKIDFRIKMSDMRISGIYFNGSSKSKIKIGDKADVVYTLDENIWNGNKTLQLKVKDIKKT